MSIYLDIFNDTSLNMKYLAIVLLISFISCKGTKESSSNLSAETSRKAEITTNQVTSYQEIAAEKLGEGAQFSKNKSETMVLCKKVTFSKNIPMGQAGIKSPAVPTGAGTVKLIVVNIKQGDVLFEKSIAYGGADWASDTELRIFEIMGAHIPNNPNMYLYNVLTGTKTAITKDNEKKIEKP